MNGKAQALWDEVLERVSLRVAKEGFDTWLAPTTGSKLTSTTLEVQVPNAFFAEWIGQHYMADIRTALADASPSPIEIVFKPRDVAAAATLQRPSSRTAEQARNGEYRLQARYTFTNFVVGESNRFAYAAARSVAERPGGTYNPLFIYGGVGLGKTHLIQAIGNHAISVRSNLKVQYVAAEAFFIELIQAIEKNTRLAFKQKYRRLNLLLMDDVHYLVGKERLQEEVFHIFNHLHDAGSQVVFTSDRPPKEIPTLEERLVSRLGSGLVVDIQPADLETRIAILKQKAALEEQEVPHDVAYYIAARVKSSIRELEGSLVRLLALSSLTSRPVTVELAEEALKDLLAAAVPVTKDSIILASAEHYGVTVDQIKGSRRTKHLALARQVAMYLIRQTLGLSLKEIGLSFGGKDHTTVIHAIEKVERLRTQDEAFAAQLRKLAAGINRG
jgi:chromosomal replication initiator protein